MSHSGHKILLVAQRSASSSFPPGVESRWRAGLVSILVFSQRGTMLHEVYEREVGVPSAPKTSSLFTLTLAGKGTLKSKEKNVTTEWLDAIMAHMVSVSCWPSAIILTLESRISKFAAAAKLLQSCPTLCVPIDGSPPGSHIPGILQARTLEWVAVSFSNA